MASQARFELTTFPLGGGCSIQLSYWDFKRGDILSSYSCFVMLVLSQLNGFVTVLRAIVFTLKKGE